MKKIKYWLFLLKCLKRDLKRYPNNHIKSRYFYGVEFTNSNNISIDDSSNIEKGTVLIVSDPKNETEKDITIKKYCWIGRNVEIQTHYGSKIIINDYASVQDRCKLLGSVSIGKYSILAPDIFISSGNHFFSKYPHLTIREQDALELNNATLFFKNDKKVSIDEDCWIGKNVFIKQGISVGRGSIIGANSFVGENVEPYSVMMGSPAKKLKNRLEFSPPNELSPFNDLLLPYFYSGFEHYIPGTKIQTQILNNKGILSENNSLTVLKQNNWKEIEITGRSISSGKISVYIDGDLYSEQELTANSDFFIHLNKSSISTEKILDYCNLPDYIKKFLCVNFIFVSDKSNISYNFIISKIMLV